MKQSSFLQLIMLIVLAFQAILAGPPTEALIQQVLLHPTCAQTFIRSAQKQYPHSPLISEDNRTFQDFR